MKAIIFDFDGVIVESVKIKTDAFRKLFSPWPEHAERMAQYHLKHTGISRFVKIRYFFQEILKKDFTESTVEKMAKEYSDLVLDGVKKAPFVRGAKEFLAKFNNKYLFFVVSGTPEDELKEIVAHRGLDKYFKGVYGSPKTKDEIVEKILADNNLTESEVIFVGDGESDLKTADNLGIQFVLRETDDNAYVKLACTNFILDLTELEREVKSIEKSSIKQKLKK